MKIRSAFFLSLFLATSFLHAQDAFPPHLLWKVSKGKKCTAYLFGTMHLTDPRLTQWSKEFHDAFRSCRYVAGEVDMLNIETTISMLRGSVMEDSTLAMCLSAEDYAFVRDYVREHRPDLEGAQLNKMKPYFTLMELWGEGMGMEDLERIPDYRIQLMARERKKKIIGLEDPAEHMKVFDSISYRDQARELVAFLREGKESLDLALAVELYLAQDVERLMEQDWGTMDSEELEEVLLHDRNAIMAQQLEETMKKGRVFCAVGAAHLIGDTGLVHVLRARGYTVEPVPFTFLP